MSVSSPSKNLVVHLHQHKPIVSCRVPSTLATMLDTRPTAESIEFLVSHMDHTGQGGPPYPATYPATLNDDEDLRALTGEVEQHAQGQKPAGPTGPQGGGSMPLGAPLMGDGKGRSSSHPSCLPLFIVDSLCSHPDRQCPCPRARHRSRGHPAVACPDPDDATRRNDHQ